MNEVKIAAGLFKGALDHLESVNFPILSKFGETVEVTCSCGNIGRIGLGNNIAKVSCFSFFLNFVSICLFVLFIYVSYLFIFSGRYRWKGRNHRC